VKSSISVILTLPRSRHRSDDQHLRTLEESGDTQRCEIEQSRIKIQARIKRSKQKSACKVIQQNKRKYKEENRSKKIQRRKKMKGMTVSKSASSIIRKRRRAHLLKQRNMRSAVQVAYHSEEDEQDDE
jgi:hypothetical protein